MIEHISWFNGLKMLQESYRVLKHGGKIRIATPDLNVFIELYNNKNQLTNNYVKWVTDRFMKGIEIYSATFIINNIFRNWDHAFLYDKELLSFSLQKAGFINIKSEKYGNSDDENLRNLERHGINIGNTEMASFETMIVEATKP